MSKKAEKRNKKSSRDQDTIIELSLPKSSEIRFLSSVSIKLQGHTNSEELQVPPTTPRNLIPDYEISRLPNILPKLTTIPWVREIGVKETITRLSDVYSCKQFQCNLLQFWFLDFVTDCLWTIQDEYQFPEEHQKVVLEWVLYAFNLIRAPDINLSRQQMFRIFGEALNVAENYIETGASIIPLPEDLFEIKNEPQDFPHQVSPRSSSASSVDSSIDINVTRGNASYIGIEFKDGIKFFDLPQKICPWDTDEDCLSSSIETISEDEVIIVKQESDVIEESDLGNADLMFEDFYKPDLSTPPRFKASVESYSDDSINITLSEESYNIEIEEEEEEEQKLDKPNWFITKSKIPDGPCPSKIFDYVSDRSSLKADEEKIEEDMLQHWFDYHLWQLRKSDMADPSRGWLPTSQTLLNIVDEKTYVDQVNSDTISAEARLMNYLEDMKDKLKEIKRNQFINTCVIMAIKQIVRQYFYDSFQFNIIRAAYRYPQYLTTQQLNTEWCVPKILKEEFKRPKPRIPKKPKVHKEKKEKAPKRKSTKSSKETSKSSKETKKSSKKEIPPKKGLTKVEKAELARLQLEMKRNEELEKKALENKMFMFPLTDAVEDDLFEKIFENWVKPKRKGDKKDKKR